MSKLHLAYIAGLVDGEGCIRIDKSNPKGRSTHYKLEVDISNTCLEPLLAIHKQFRGNMRTVLPHYYGKTLTKRAYILTLVCQEAACFLRAIVKYLVIKRKQAELALEFDCKKTKGIPAPGVRLSTQELELRECYYQRMKLLNK